MTLATAVFLGSLLAATIQAPPPDKPPVDPAAAVKGDLTTLVRDLNAAMKAKDRAGLERVYAPEFRWVHALGYAEDRAAHVERILATEAGPGVPLPSFDPPRELLLLGDVAILRGPAESRAGGALWSTVTYARRDGRWQIVHMQGTAMQPPRTTVAVPAAVLDACAGRYERAAGGAVTVFTREGDVLVMQHPDVPRRTLTATAADTFVDELGNEYRFHAGPDGRMARYTVRLANGRELSSTRVP